MTIETMTSRERMRRALTGVLPDRVPFFPTIAQDHAAVACGHRFEELLIDPDLSPVMMLGAAQRYGADSVRFMMGYPDAWRRDKTVREQDGALIQFDRHTGKADGSLDVEGGGALHLYEPPSPVTTVEAARALPVIPAEEYFQRGYMRAVAPKIAEAHACGLFVVGLCSGQTLNFMVTAMGGAEQALLSFYDTPDVARALIDKAVQISVAKAAAFIKGGADCIYIGDSYTSGSVISPAIYREFCAPAYREAAQEVHRMGALCYKHCCGNYNPFLDDLPETGVDGMDGIDPTSGMSVVETKRRVGDRVTLMGGLSCLTLWRGTPDDVYKEACQCINSGKPGGRYTLGSACAVARMTPAENLAAARKAVLDQGWYG